MPAGSDGRDGRDLPSRAELELALRAAHLSIAELREDLHALAAQVVALTELAAPSAAAGEAGDPAVFEEKVAARTAELRHELAVSDERSSDRVMLGRPSDKYTEGPQASDGGPPCLEILPICGARCCSFEVSLTTQDLDEGQLRWDYARPYLLAKREGSKEAGDALCVYNEAGCCQVYEVRPAACRRYDCRTDARIWIDYERRILTPALRQPALPRAALEADARDRQHAMFVEASRLRRRR